MLGEENECGYAPDPENPETWPQGVEVDLDAVQDDSLPACRREPIEGEDRCGLHLPIEEQPEGFDPVEAIADDLRAVDDINRRTTGPANKTSFVGIRVGDLDLRDLEEEIEAHDLVLDFRFARIAGRFDVRNLRFRGRLQLDGASVEGVHAQSATFESGISLAGSRIGEEADGGAEAVVLDLSNVRSIRGGLSLEHARVGGTAIVSQIDSVDRLRASNASIDGQFHLSGTVVDEEVTLRTLTCAQLFAEGARFERGVEWNRIHVRESAELKHAHFGAGDDEPVTVTNATVGGQFDLEQATFHADAELGELTVEGPTRFRSTEFEKSVTLGEAEFGEAVLAEEVTVQGKAEFADATFAGDTSFDRATFDGPVRFDDATFEDDCVFRSRANPDGDSDSPTEESASDDEPAAEQPAGVNSPDQTKATSDGGSARRSGIFGDDLSLVGASFDGAVDFRVFEPSTPTREFTPEDAVADDAITVEGDFESAGATLTGADMTGFRCEGRIDLREADLTRATLRNADLRGADAENATFSHANCFGARLDGADLHGAVFEGTRIDDQTAFGEAVSYDRRASTASDPGEEDHHLTKAISVYSQLETLARENGQMDVARWAFVKRKDAKRAQFETTGDTRAYWSASAKKFVMNYGESWWQVLKVSFGVVFVLGVLFPSPIPYLDLRHEAVGDISYAACASHGLSLDGVRCAGEQVVYGLLYSFSSFAALGTGGFAPGLGASVIATLEAVFGVLMLGLLLFVLQRRTAR